MKCNNVEEIFVSFNMTEFMSEHPGGNEVLEESAGKDVTEKYQAIGHSKISKITKETLKVGYIRV